MLSVDGHDVKTTGELRNLVASQASGKTVAVVIMRGGEQRTIDVQLGTLPQGKDTHAAPAKTSSAHSRRHPISDLGPEAKRESASATRSTAEP